MILALTGTPGTGKTSIAEELEKQGWKVIDLREFIEEHELGEKKDELEVDVEELMDRLHEELADSSDNLVLEGHLSHHYPADFCVVLRCEPEELRRRLEERDYSEEKTEENVEAEAIDLILQEAIERQENIIEVDTTEKSAKETADEILQRLEHGDTGYGEIDWSEYI